MDVIFKAGGRASLGGRRTAFAVAAIAAVLLASGCGGAGKNSPPPTTAAETSPTPSANAPAIICSVVKAVASGDAAQIQALIRYQSVPCASAPSGAGAPPLCHDAEAPGTPVNALIAASCEGNYVRADQLASTDVVKNAVGADVRLWAAYEYVGDAFGPDAKYFIIFERRQPLSNGTGYGIVTTDAAVLGMHYGCGWSPAEFGKFTQFGSAVVPPRS